MTRPGRQTLLQRLARFFSSALAPVALFWLVLGVLAGASTSAFAQARSSPSLPAPELAARTFLLYDLSSGQVLAQRESERIVDPAGLTQLMTAYVVFDALRAGRLRLEQRIVLSEAAWRTPGPRTFAPQGTEMSVHDLLQGLIVLGAHDAAVALAEGVAGTSDRFAERMNQQAQAMGLRNTRFLHPHGLGAPGHQTTAADMARLAARLVRDFPQHLGYFAQHRYRYSGAPAVNDTNRNLLLFRDPTVDGLMTAQSASLGYAIVASSQRPLPARPGAQTQQRRLLAVVLGASSENARASESQRLLNWGFSAFEAVQLFAPGQAVAEPPVWQGQAAQVRLGHPSGIVITLPAGQAQGLRTEVVRPEPLRAPLIAGQTLGTLRIRNAQGELLAERPLYVLDTVEQAGLLGRAWGAFRLWVQ